MPRAEMRIFPSVMFAKAYRCLVEIQNSSVNYVGVFQGKYVV